MRKRRSYILIAMLVALVGIGVSGTNAQQLSARAAVGANSAFVGEAIRFQIQVEGSESPDTPDLSQIKDFSVTATNARTNSRSSTTIINGQMTRRVSKGFLYDYTLTPKREGSLVIPPITVSAGGTMTQTNPVRITASKPSEAENFKLRTTLSRKTAYVGEPIILEVVFYYSANVSDPNLSMQGIETGEFHIYDIANDESDGKVQMLDQQQFQTMRLRKVLVPKQAGSITIAPATLSFKGEDGFTYARDFFGKRVRQSKWRRFVVPSNEEKLEVSELPTAGRPDGFAGHIGEYSITASATPLEVNVGDPITLRVSLSGPPYLEHVTFPSLHLQKGLTADFKVPEEMEAGAVNGNFKVFTQTIRATGDQVTEIPPIELPYFDSDSGTYKVAKSRPIPIKVKATNVVTADDAEGMAPVTGGSTQVEAWSRGIAHNYEDLDVLQDQQFNAVSWLTRPATLGVLAAGPIAYFALAGLTAARRRRDADPGKLKSRKALGQLQRDMKQANDPAGALQSFRSYLGSKLDVPSGALTYRDVEQPLVSKDLSADSLAEIKAVFDQCEASRYAGGGSADMAALTQKVLTSADSIERRIK